MNPLIECSSNGDTGYFTVRWSALRTMECRQIAKSVPATGGVYEVYWMDDHKKLRLLIIGNANMGGLRSEIRRLIDPELTDNMDLAKLLEDHEIWFRYAISESAKDMADVVWFFKKTYFPENPGVSHSGRFTRIFLKESAPDKVRWID